jgi:MFS transporter, PPP family, 3-phenylpropionic acid transporter
MLQFSMLNLKKPVLYAAGMYFGFYLALGAYMPYITLYYDHIGLSGVQIGILSALPVLVVSATSLFWGAVSDAFRLHKLILSLALLLSPLAVLMIPRTTEFAVLIPIVLVYAIFGSPVVPLLDSSALEVAKNNRSSFGILRVWGSVGWTISTLVIGAYIERSDIRVFFYIYAVFMGLLFLLSFFQPQRTYSVKTTLIQNLRPFIRRDIGVFLLSIYLVATTSGAVLTFFSIYMHRIGAGEGLIGLGWALASVSEIPVMIFSVVIIRRIGSIGLLKISFFVFALRWLCFAFISVPGWALAVQLLHGLSFAPFLVGGVTYINERSPEGMSATGQSLLTTVTFGLGSISGALLGGHLIDRVGVSNLFLILSGIAFMGFILFSVGGTERFIAITRKFI